MFSRRLVILLGYAAVQCLIVAWLAGSPVSRGLAQAQNILQERLVVRLGRQIASLTWFDENTLLATILGVGYTQDVGLVDLKSGEIRPLSSGFCASPSPDRTRLAWVQGRASGNAWILDLRTRSQRQITAGLRVTCVSWSPDGRWIAVLSSPWREGQDEIQIISADNGRKEHAIGGGDLKLGRPAWAPDSQRLAFSVYRFVWTSLSPPRFSHPVRRIDLFELRERRRSTYLDMGSGESGLGDLAFRPDGQVLLFVTYAPSQIAAYDGHTVKTLTTGRALAWHPSGNAFLFARGYDCASGGIICAGDDLYLIDY